MLPWCLWSSPWFLLCSIPSYGYDPLFQFSISYLHFRFVDVDFYSYLFPISTIVLIMICSSVLDFNTTTRSSAYFIVVFILPPIEKSPVSSNTSLTSYSFVQGGVRSVTCNSVCIFLIHLDVYFLLHIHTLDNLVVSLIDANRFQNFCRCIPVDSVEGSWTSRHLSDIILNIPMSSLVTFPVLKPNCFLLIFCTILFLCRLVSILVSTFSVCEVNCPVVTCLLWAFSQDLSLWHPESSLAICPFSIFIYSVQ